MKDAVATGVSYISMIPSKHRYTAASVSGRMERMDVRIANLEGNVGKSRFDLKTPVKSNKNKQLL